jgi:hypothetical protein
MRTEASGLLPSEGTLIKDTALALWDNAPLLAVSALVLSLLWVPAVSLLVAGLPLGALLLGASLGLPAWAGLTSLQAALLEGCHANLWTLFRGMGRYWLRSALLGLLLCFPMVMALLTLPMLSLETVPRFVWAALFADGFVALALLAIALYAVPLWPLRELRFGAAFLEGAILAARRPWHTMGLIGMGLLFGLAIEWHQALAFFLPTIWCLFIVNNARLVVAPEVFPHTEG